MTTMIEIGLLAVEDYKARQRFREAVRNIEETGEPLSYEAEMSNFRALPTFEGWTVDTRLKQFRKMDEAIVILDFNTPEGDELLARYIESGLDRDELLRVLEAIV